MISTFIIIFVILATIAFMLIKISRNKLPDPDFKINYTAGLQFANDNGPATKQDEVIKLVVLGDSTVQGIGATSAKTSLAGQIAEKAANELQKPIHVRAFGKSGATTKDVIDNQIEHIDDDVDVVVIEVGSNDVTHFTKLDDVRDLTERLIVKIRKTAPQAEIIIGSSGTLDSPVFGPLRQFVKNRATKVRARQEAVCKQQDVYFMNVAKDVEPEFLKTPGASASDNFHPSDIGYEIWARPLADLVVESMKE
jgi:lysophospholipase L1-like esterase